MEKQTKIPAALLIALTAMEEQIEALTQAVTQIATQPTIKAEAVMDIKGLIKSGLTPYTKESTIRRMIKEKTIPHFKKGRYVFFKREEIERWIAIGDEEITLDDLNTEDSLFA